MTNPWTASSSAGKITHKYWKKYNTLCMCFFVNNENIKKTSAKFLMA